MSYRIEVMRHAGCAFMLYVVDDEEQCLSAIPVLDRELGELRRGEPEGRGLTFALAQFLAGKINQGVRSVADGVEEG